MTTPKGFLLALIAGGPLLAQAAPEPISSWATGSAAAALGGVVAWLLTKTIPGMQRDFRQILDTMAKRYDSWEQIRHIDSNALNQTLRAMSVVCARVHEINQPAHPPKSPDAPPAAPTDMPG